MGERVVAGTETRALCMHPQYEADLIYARLGLQALLLLCGLQTGGN